MDDFFHHNDPLHGGAAEQPGEVPPPAADSDAAAQDSLRSDNGSPDTETAPSSLSPSPPSTPSPSSTLSSSSNLPVSVSLPYSDPFAPPPPRKRRTGLVILCCLVCALLLGLASTSVYVLVHYGLPDGLALQSTEAAPSQTVPPGTTVLPDGLPSAGGSAAAEEPAETETASAPVYVTPAGTNVTVAISETPAGDPLSFPAIYEKCIGAVVSITAVSNSSISMGTGILMTADGYVITNNHIIEGGVSLTVTLQDDREYTAALVGADSTNDLAVLKIDAENLPVAEFGDSDALRVGDTVVAIGNPTTSEELRGTMTDGIVSAINRNINLDGILMTLIQTNAALNSGNSGGPLINAYGQVVGINIMKFASANTSYEGLGFAIPMSVAKPILDELIANGRITGRPSIGIMASTVPASAAAYYNTPQGVLVESIDERSRAVESGLQVGDIITAFNGEPISDNLALRDAKAAFRAGDTVTLTVYRGGQYLELELILTDEADLG